MRALLSRDEAIADSIVVGVLLCLLTLCGLEVYMAIVDHASWSATGFAGGAAVILGAGGGVKTVRDRFGNEPGH